MKNLISLFKIGALILIAFFMGAFIAQAAGAPEMMVPAGTALVALSFIPKGNMVGQLNSIIATDIIAEFGAYYRAGSANIKDILDQILMKSQTEKYFNRRVTEDTLKQGATAEVSTVLQAFQKQWTPNVDVTFNPLEQKLYRLKIDAEFYPDELHETWLAFLTDNNLDRKTWPFVRYVVKKIIEKSHEDYEKNEIYKGVYSAPVAGTANGAGENVQGLKQQLNDLHDAGSVNTITMGAMPSTAELIVPYFETFDKSIFDTNEELATEIDAYFVSPKNARLFREGMRAKYNSNYAQADLAKLIDSDIPVIGLNSMKGSNKIWATPKINRVQYVKAPGNENIMRAENVDRLVKLYTDYWKSIGFWNPEWVFQNDVELNPVDPG